MSLPPVDLSGLSLGQLQDRLLVVENDLASVKAKLDQVRAKRHTEGTFADPEWYRRAITRQRFLGVEHQALTRRIAEAKREARAARQTRLGDAFITTARAVLTPDVFTEVMRQAEAAIAE